MKKAVFFYGSVLALFLACLKLLEYSFFTYKITPGLYLALTAIIFLLAGIFLTARFYTYHAKIRKEIASNNFNDFNHKLLSERENEVLALIAEGFTNKEISGRLFISQNTVKTHIKRIYEKLDVSNRVQAVKNVRKHSQPGKNHPTG